MESLIGAMVALVLSMLSVGGFMTWAVVGSKNVQNAVVASQGQTFIKAAMQYVGDYGTTIAATATATVPVTITPAMLSAASYLPGGFSSTNAFMQTWQLQVLQPTAGTLQSLVTSVGGRAISDTKQLVQIAAQMSSQYGPGGFIPYANQAGDATMNANTAYGAYGAWKIAMTGYTNPGSGHLAALLAFTSAATNGSYLYRVQVPGQPQLNAMQTDLSLTDTGGTAHNSTGANSYQTKGGGQLNNDQGGSLELGGNNSTAGAGTPYIDFHLAGQGVQDYNARVINDADGHVALIAASGKAGLQVQGTLQAGNVATPNTACTTNGVIAANSDGSGQILSCQYGNWLPIGGRVLRMAYYTVQNGWGVPAPTCPGGGIPEIEVDPQTFYVNPTAVVNFGPVTGTGPWVVHITDGAGNPNSGTAVASTYCAY
ncbi:shufflon system plasmid conjugative transfer pilus tip adhesin PilV [Burkholderia sp. Ac-20365]|uniref:shufflon system plasmid conjugative transfer pilus tip adhesin PilV n=1 Tax=Burkholderia sp. Ac-20365 TaxID=2703897 RepID=UPI00197C745A|nr:shufflon system plasmid conjugative transfer pilus tip adhesin PilV [Burkholderia sp. Ac-20365]MBN3761074.1 shufflon system plasmid conjugative transfer pilus tip adhesin PilV [Burkholderia sp. Ac-20365]